MANDRGSSAVTSGIGFGACLAMVISFALNHSVLWAIVHGIFGWVYVFYYLIAIPH